MAYGGDLQANTAVDVMVGPFVDEDNGKTAETTLTITQAEVRLSKNGGNMAQKSEATSLTHDELGNYVCKLDTTDTNTEGILTLMVHESGALPIKMDYTVLAQATYISKYTAKDTGFIDVNIKTVGRTDTQETEANNLESACSNYSATRGLTGTAVPAAVADAAGGLMVSDDGGWDADELYDAIVTDAIGANIAIDIIAVKAETASIQTETTALDTLTKAAGDGDLAAILLDTIEIGAAGAGLTDITINAASVTAVWAKAMSDLAQGAPSVTASVLTAINYIYEAWRNKSTATATLYTLFKDDKTTGVVKSTLSDAAGTTTKDEMISGA